MMRFLIRSGADVRIKDHQGRNAVHYLCYYYRTAKPVRDLLVETGVYTEDLEVDMDWKVVVPLMKEVGRIRALDIR
jgi:hypothetical protein